MVGAVIEEAQVSHYGGDGGDGDGGDGGGDGGDGDGDDGGDGSGEVLPCRPSERSVVLQVMWLGYGWWFNSRASIPPVCALSTTLCGPAPGQEAPGKERHMVADASVRDGHSDLHRGRRGCDGGGHRPSHGRHWPKARSYAPPPLFPPMRNTVLLIVSLLVCLLFFFGGGVNVVACEMRYVNLYGLLHLHFLCLILFIFLLCVCSHHIGGGRVPAASDKQFSAWR